jgi:hypothetical protein
VSGLRPTPNCRLYTTCLSGYGRANISFLFRQVKTALPKNLLGWETGTVEILGDISVEATPEYQEGFNTKKLTVSTSDDEYKVPSSAATVANGNVSWDLPVDKVRLPVYNRYASAVVFEIGSGGIGPFGSDSDFVAMCWLKDVADDEETEIRVPVIRSKKLSQLRQNYSESCCGCIDGTPALILFESTTRLRTRITMMSWAG